MLQVGQSARFYSDVCRQTTARGGRNLLLILSDLELGHGTQADDCPYSAYLSQRLCSEVESAKEYREVDIVLNGDTLDFLKTPVEGSYLNQVSEDEALDKLSRIYQAHRSFFSDLKYLLSSSRALVRLHWIVGNHDFELLLPRVQSRLRAILGHEFQVHFPGFELDLGEVHIEHGSQGDRMFHFDTSQARDVEAGASQLMLPWGVELLNHVALPYHQEIPHLDRVRTKSDLFKILPEAKELLRGSLWSYWSTNFRKQGGQFVSGGSLSAWAELLYRTILGDAEIDISRYYRRALTRSPSRVFVIGHSHTYFRKRLGWQTLVSLPCLRSEFFVDPQTLEEKPGLKGFLKVDLSQGRVQALDLVSIDVPHELLTHSKENLLSYREDILELLSPNSKVA